METDVIRFVAGRLAMGCNRLYDGAYLASQGQLVPEASKFFSRDLQNYRWQLQAIFDGFNRLLAQFSTDTARTSKFVSFAAQSY